MEQEEAKAPLDVLEDKPEPRIFNQDARDALEIAFAEFEGAPSPETAPVETAPPATADKPVEQAASEPTVITETPEAEPTQFRTIEDAEKSYRNARLKMQEATEKAARLDRENDQLRRATQEAIETSRRMQAVPPPSTQPTPPQFTKEEMEAKFFEDPVGFMFSMQEAARRAAIDEMENKTKAQRDTERRQMAVEQFTKSTQKYFDDTYQDLKPIEPLVTDEIQKVWTDSSFMKPLMDDRAKDVISKAKSVVDEATKRLRSRFPDIGRSLGFSSPGESMTERLTSGAPPVVPGGASGPSVRPSALPAGESNEEYIQSRLKKQDRMRASTWTR